jgi:putative flippase GtrA
VPLADVTAGLGRTSEAGASGDARSQVVLFAMVGVCSTLAYAALYVLLRGTVGPFWANGAALVLTALGNTAANRRLTFGLRGRRHALRHQAQGLVVFAVGLAVTTGSLWLLDRLVGSPGHAAEVAVLTAANLFVTVMRFVAMRGWVFAGR